MLLIFCSQIQLSVKSKSAFIKRLVNKVFLPVILKIETAFANSLILSLRSSPFLPPAFIYQSRDLLSLSIDRFHVKSTLSKILN